MIDRCPHVISIQGLDLRVADMDPRCSLKEFHGGEHQTFTFQVFSDERVGGDERNPARAILWWRP